MLWWYILSVAAGLALGGVYAVIFYKGNKCFLGQQEPGEKPLLRTFGVFFLRYFLLFAAFWVLFLTCQLNIYFGIAGFFVAYWGVLLKATHEVKTDGPKTKDHDEP